MRRSLIFVKKTRNLASTVKNVVPIHARNANYRLMEINPARSLLKNSTATGFKITHKHTCVQIANAKLKKMVGAHTCNAAAANTTGAGSVDSAWVENIDYSQEWITSTSSVKCSLKQNNHNGLR